MHVSCVGVDCSPPVTRMWPHVCLQDEQIAGIQLTCPLSWSESSMMTAKNRPPDGMDGSLLVGGSAGGAKNPIRQVINRPAETIDTVTRV